MGANSKTLLQVVFTAISGLIIGLVIALLTGLIPGEAQAKNDAVAEALHMAETLWPSRDQDNNTALAIAILNQAKSDHPYDYGIRWQLARFIRWQAVDGTAANKADHGRRCWEEAKVAIELQPDGVEGHYWAGVCIGTYGQGVSKARAILEGVPDAFEVAIHTAIEIDSTHDQGGPLRALGRYYTTLPWPYRNLDKAKVWIDRALVVDAASPANLFFLAEMAQREGDETAAREAIGRLMALGESDGDPSRVRHYQDKARILLAEMG